MRWLAQIYVQLHMLLGTHTFGALFTYICVGKLDFSVNQHLVEFRCSLSLRICGSIQETILGCQRLMSPARESHTQQNSSPVLETVLAFVDAELCVFI